ncbi:MAG: glycosyltransferase family 39 protein [Gemmatimonadota bacterium]|nr:glycosyltransferase family 39 protein [Gemmatimonadota bacterium]MDH3421485.1 glycosyltransferase family 39 protein [Gemmatimonadota bacterium]
MRRTDYLDRIDRNQGAIVFYAGCLALAAKLLLSASAYGTNDVTSWAEFMRYVRDVDSVSIYRAIPLYNHPPLVSGYLWILGALIGDESPLFPFLLRLPSILADCGSIWFTWKLSQVYFADRRALWVTLTFALSPTLILVSGFHGNSDPVFLFFILFSLYMLLVQRNLFVAGLLFGLSVNIKVVPLILLPAFFFLTGRTANRMRFFGAAALMVIAGYGYHLSQDFESLVGNIFFYRGLPQVWGLGRYLEFYRDFGTLVMESAIIALTALLGWRAGHMAEGFQRDRKLLEAFSITFLATLALAPGFGVQYLAWLVPAFSFVGPVAAIAYSLSSGMLLLIVYRNWSGGFPLYFADSLSRGWGSFVQNLINAEWIFISAVFVWFTMRVLRPPAEREL